MAPFAWQFVGGVTLVLPLLVLPGPQLLLVVAETMRAGRGAGAGAAAGSVLGSGVALTLGVAGLRYVVRSAAGHRIVSLLGGTILLAIAFLAVLDRGGTGAAGDPDARAPLARPFCRGIAVSLLNPVGLVWCSTVGASAVSVAYTAGTPAVVGLALGLLTAAVGWLATVVAIGTRGAAVLSARWYRGCGRAAATALAFWGVFFLVKGFS